MKKRKSIDIQKTGHIVVLDPSYHELFKDSKSVRIKTLENKLNKLLKEQGKANNDYKAYLVLKKQLMAEIVDGMSGAFDDDDSETKSKLKQNEKNIREINRKIEHLENSKLVLPGKIETVNGELLKESMAVCYEKMVKNKSEVNRLETEINDLHNKVKSMIGEKEDMDSEINKLYHYMHDIAGIEVIEQYDKLYFGEDS